MAEAAYPASIWEGPVSLWKERAQRVYDQPAGCCPGATDTNGHRHGAGQSEWETAKRLPVAVAAGLAARGTAERKGQKRLGQVLESQQGRGGLYGQGQGVSALRTSSKFTTYSSYLHPSRLS